MSDRFTTRTCDRCGRFHWFVTDGKETCACGNEIEMLYIHTDSDR